MKPKELEQLAAAWELAARRANLTATKSCDLATVRAAEERAKALGQCAHELRRAMEGKT